MSNFQSLVSVASTIRSLTVRSHKYITELPKVPSYFNPEKRAYRNFIEAKRRNFCGEKLHNETMVALVKADPIESDQQEYEVLIEFAKDDKSEVKALKESREVRQSMLKKIKHEMITNCERDLGITFTDEVAEGWKYKESEPVEVAVS